MRYSEASINSYGHMLLKEWDQTKEKFCMVREKNNSYNKFKEVPVWH